MTIQNLYLTDTIDEALVDKIHAEIVTIDGHIDVRDGFNSPGNDAGQDTEGQFDLPKLLRGKLKVSVVALAADAVPDTAEGHTRARQQIEAKYNALAKLVADHPQHLAFARSSADIKDIISTGKQAILLSFLNAVSLGTDLSALKIFHERGVRLLGLVHIGNNAFAHSSRPNKAFGDKPDNNLGLTDLGKEAVTELNRLGIIVDVTQLSPRGLEETISLSKTPVIASHSAVRGRVDSPRNLSNSELKAIAESGGVVNIVAFAPYLRDRDGSQEAFNTEVFAPFNLRQGLDDPRAVLSAEDFERFQAGYRKFSGKRHQFASLVDYLDAVDYAVRLIGIDHVGLSSDFNNGGGVIGYAHVGEAKNVTRELVRRGYDQTAIEKLWGGNFLRVLKQAEAFSAS
ncbi:dipeptidase [Agrobacterium sp. AGB01]|uniref:dipeptidase n=1 Tax=Agrobacterium sp. AGB01 TaxID=2769302 RepID=UPI001783B189|nr:dipeptidase [Agrobacterium sp. AGB01]MBD9388542.1 dipeptidase [Agrobacterium sp. AGB01]